MFTDDFLFDGLDETCKLPCWNHLTVGKSRPQDIASVLGEGFDFGDGGRNAREDPIGLEGYSSRVFQWFFDPDNNDDNISMAVVVGKVDPILSAVRFSWQNGKYDEYLSPQRILQKLGPPSEMLVDFAGTGLTSTQIFDVLIIYDSGVIFYTETIIPVTPAGAHPASKQEAGRVVTACLGGDNWSDPDIARVRAPQRKFYIVDTTSPGANIRSFLYDWAIDDLPIRREGMMPIQDVFGVSLQEIVQLASDDQNACLTADAPNL